MLIELFAFRIMSLSFAPPVKDIMFRLAARRRPDCKQRTVRPAHG